MAKRKSEEENKMSNEELSILKVAALEDNREFRRYVISKLDSLSDDVSQNKAAISGLQSEIKSAVRTTSTITSAVTGVIVAGMSKLGVV